MGQLSDSSRAAPSSVGLDFSLVFAGQEGDAHSVDSG